MQRLCPDCGEPLEIRTNTHNGTQFYGCTDFPSCRYTEPLEEDLDDGFEERLEDLNNYK